MIAALIALGLALTAGLLGSRRRTRTRSDTGADTAAGDERAAGAGRAEVADSLPEEHPDRDLPVRAPRTDRRRERQRTALAAGLFCLCAIASMAITGVLPLPAATVSAVGTPPAPETTPTTTAVEEPPRPDCTRLDCVTLTFDDGPSPYTTGALLDTLEAHDVPANFFVLGYLIEGNEGIIRRMERLGMGVENHTWDHPDLAALSTSAVADQLTRTDAEITRVLGAKPRYMRPPYGSWVPGHTPTGGMRPVMWEVDPQDWLYRSSSVVAQSVINQTSPGDVILLHDIHQSSIDAVPAIIEGLRQRGFTFVLLDDLYAARPTCPVTLYCTPTTTPATTTPTTTPTTSSTTGTTSASRANPASLAAPR